MSISDTITWFELKNPGGMSLILLNRKSLEKEKSYIWIWTPRFKIMDVLFKMNQNIQFLDYSDLMAISHEVEYKSHSLFLNI